MSYRVYNLMNCSCKIEFRIELITNFLLPQTNKEKLIFCDDDCELQELKLDDDDLDELLE